MKKSKVILFSRDPGGANTVIPLYDPLCSKGYDVTLFGKDIALQKYAAAGLVGEDIMTRIHSVDLASIRSFLLAEKPDLMITGTSADDFCEKYLWKTAEELGLTSFAILDQWINYGVRFSEFSCSQAEESLKFRKYLYLPRKICVMDELARQEALDEGLPADRLVVTGQPHLQALAARQSADKEQSASVRSAYGVDARACLVVFASEPIAEGWGGRTPYFGYTELSVLAHLVSALDVIAASMQQSIVLVVRPHPREDVAKFKKVGLLVSDKIKVVISSEHSSDDLIQASDIVCGMSSMFLLESVVWRRPTVSIQIGLKGKSLFVLDRSNILKSALDQEQLVQMLSTILLGKEYVPPCLGFIGDPVKNIITLVASCVASAHAEVQ